MISIPQDRRDYTDLKEYIQETLGKEITRLTKAFDHQALVLREIELKTTTRTAELQKDIDGISRKQEELEREISRIYESMEQEEQTRQFISNENRNLISNVKGEQTVKWEIQMKMNANFENLNESFKSLSNRIWGIFIILFGILAGFVWTLITGG